MEKDWWWDAWPTAWTTDDEIEAMIDEEGYEIAKELLTHIRDSRREGNKSVVDVEKSVDVEQEETAA